MLFGPVVGIQAQTPNPNKDIEVTPGPEDAVSSLAWHPVENVLAASSWDKQVRIWKFQPNNTSVPAAAIVTNAPPLCISFHTSGAQVFSGGCDNEALCWDLASNRTMVIGKHDAPVKFVKWLGDKNCLVTGSWDKTVKYWDPRQSNTPAVVFNMSNKLFAADVVGDLGIFACSERKIHVVDVRTPNIPNRTVDSPLKFQTKSVAVFPNQSGFALGSVEGRVAIQDLRQETESFTFKCHRKTDILPVNCIDFHPSIDGAFATVGGDGIMNFFNKNTRKLLKEFLPCYLPLTSCKFNPTGTCIAYSVCYDFSRGVPGLEQVIQRGQKNHILVHGCQSNEIRPT